MEQLDRMQTQEEVDEILYQLRNNVYNSSWEEMQQDLIARHEARPYVYKRHRKIKTDLARIEELKGLEAKTA